MTKERLPDCTRERHMVTPTPETRALIQDLVARSKSSDMNWPELRAYYGGVANEIYEAKVAGNKELADTLETLRDTMVEALAAGAAFRGMESEFEEAMAMEKAIERRTFFLRMAANRMKAVRPAMFSLELLGSGAVVIAIMYFVLRSGPEWALLCGALLMAARYFLPNILNRMALNQERGLRRIRNPQSPVARIFPSVREYFRENSKGVVPPIIRDSDEGRRISDPIFFPRYFSYTVPTTMFGEREMAEFLSAIEKAASEEALRAAVETTWPAAERDDLRRIHFLRTLLSKASQISGQRAPWLAVEMAKRTSEMQSDHVVYQVIKGLIFGLAARSEGSPDFQRTLDQVVKEAGSAGFASDIVYSSVSPRNRVDQVTNWDGFDADQIKKVFGQRMRLRYQKPVRAVLTSKPNDPLAFSRWRLYVPEDAPYITEFLRSAFDFNIENLGVFLHWLLPGNVIYQDGAIKFIEGFYPVSEIILRLKKAQEDKVQWCPEHAAAIQRFWDFNNRESSSSNLPEPDEKSEVDA